MAAAVTLGALVGPSQVLARVLEMIIGRRFHPIWTMFSSTVLVTTGLVLLSFHLPVVALGLVFFGAAMQADHDIKILKEHYLEVVTKDLRLGATADCYRLARVWQARLMARFESNVAISAGSGGRCS